MNTVEYTQQIMNDLISFPESKIIEVFDFVHFLKQQIKKKKITSKDVGLSREEAFDLRRRLSTFENDWNLAEMDIYDEL